MGTVRRVRRAWGRGGPREVVLASRRWLARLIYPGDIPAPKRRRRHRAVPATGPSAALDARDVEHAQAMEWFGRRHATYVRLSEAVRDYVDPEGTIIDVGANIGYFTKVLGETLDFRGTAHLFEPLEHLASLCDQTLARAPYTVHVHPYALGDTDTKLDIFVDTSGGNLGWNTLVAERATASMLATTIDVKPFTATAIERAPCFLKIDVEGAEHLVIAGMADALASWDTRPVILCEIGWGTVHPQWDKELEAFDMLTSLGYRTVGVDGSPVDVRELTKTTDVLFLPDHVPASSADPLSRAALR